MGDETLGPSLVEIANELARQQNGLAQPLIDAQQVSPILPTEEIPVVNATPVTVESSYPLSPIVSSQADGTLYDHALLFKTLIETALAINEPKGPPLTHKEKVRRFRSTGQHF